MTEGSVIRQAVIRRLDLTSVCRVPATFLIPRKGVAYNMMAAKKPNGAPAVTFKKLCASTDHIDTIKAFQQYGEMSCR